MSYGGPMNHTAAMLARFWSNVEVRRAWECWEWRSALTSDGYGSFSIRRGLTQLAHRIAYEFLIGPIPDGLELDHLCRNRCCVNASHLEPVTSAENTRRGESPIVQLARRAVCKWGHPLEGDNLGRRRGYPNARICKKCASSATKSWRRKLREQASPEAACG